MDTIEAIKTRRSIGKVKDIPVEKELIESLLDSAVYAPNHFRTEPWRFFVLQGDGRKPLGRTLAEIAKEKMDDPETGENQDKLQKQEEKVYRAPVIIAVAVVPSDNPRALVNEEISATSAAIQNILLTAHAKGLGAMWRTGEPCYHPKMKQLFGLEDSAMVVGFIYVGYPDMPQREGKRTPFEEKTVWVDSDNDYYTLR